jgi:hypothetical protein
MSIAILTGDLIGSTALERDEVERAFGSLSAAAESVGQWQGTSARFSRSRGDGWQLYLARPELALRAALYLRATLAALGRGVETRVAIAEGAGGPEPPEDLNAATGPVFTTSGRALDALAGGATLAHASGGALGAAVRLADHISRDWTEAQGRALLHMLPPNPPTRAEVGERLGVSRQAVDQALAAAGFPAIEAALGLIEAAG